MTPLTRDVFDGATAERRLTDYFAVATTEAFGALSRLELTAAAACVTYVERTQLGKRPPLSPPLREAAGATLSIDQATRANLELMRTLAGERRGSLLAAIDRTVTPAGSRLLAQRLAAPLTEPAAIARRLDASAVRRRRAAAQRDSRAAQHRARPGARAVAACGRPRRPARPRGDPRRHRGGRGARSAARPAAGQPAEMTERTRRAAPGRSGAGARAWRPRWPTSCRCSSATAASFVRATTPRSTRRARCATNPASVIAQLQARYADDTGVKILKIRHNNVLGYFVEVTAQHGDKLMARR